MKKILFLLLTITMLCVSALGFTACSGHAHTFDKQVVSSDYLKSEATCEAKATYYYSCECGEKGTETFESGELLSHKFTNYVSDNNATCENDGTKTANCDYGCGTKDTITDTGSKLSHVFDKEVVEEKYFNSEATCTSKATYFKSCVCGEKGTDTFEIGETAKHEYVDGKCKWCEDILDGYHFHDYSKRIVEDKYLKKEATCKSRAEYYKSCECGEYGEETFKTGDFAEHKYINGKCKWCEKVDPNAPTQPDNPNPPDNPEHTCLFNQMVAENKYLKSKATCEKKALYHYSCECGAKGEDAFEYGSALGHDYSDFISNEDGTHSKTCANDNTHIITENCSGGVATEENRPICSTCGGKYGAKLDHVHVYDKQTITDKFLESTATCENKALYHYSCECGEIGEDTFEYGSYFNHVYENGKCRWCGTAELSQSQDLYVREGNTLYFGSYPQTKVTDTTIIDVLGGTSAPESTNTWISYNYYVSRAQTDCMYYKDVSFNGKKYRGVFIKQYRPRNNSLSSTTNTYQDDNGYNTSSVYWFKYEPIEWDIVKEYNGIATLVCKMILDSQAYQNEYYYVYNDNYYTNSNNAPSRTYANNYYYSTIRSWLNDTFYNTAFNDLQKSIIQTTNLDNSLASTGFNNNPYVCENTNDKVYLLSNKEANTYFTDNSLREKKTTDYAQSQGVYTYRDSIVKYQGNGTWLLRSPINVDGGCAWGVGEEGAVNYYFYVYDFSDGVIPALRIRISEEEVKDPLYTRVGDTIYFGSYPQTKVTDTTIIDALGGSSAPESTNTWISYNYYVEGTQTDCMYYKDITYNGEKYRGVYIKQYRPYYTIYSSSNTYQDDNGYNTSSVYWFKYEPIEWEIVAENSDTATLVCKMIIDGQNYDYESDGDYYNSYAGSTIRAWLNEVFYNTAFNDLEKAIIQTTNVNNSAYSTGYYSNPYACENTDDKIYLLSYVEEETYYSSSSERAKKATDYSQSQGVCVYRGSMDAYKGYGGWLLRTPHWSDRDFSQIIDKDDASKGVIVYSTCYGVVPSLQIQL